MDINKILNKNKNHDKYKLLLDELDYKYLSKYDIKLVIEKLKNEEGP